MLHASTDVQCLHQSTLINIIVSSKGVAKISTSNKTIIDVSDDDNNDDISRSERHWNIDVKCELSSMSDQQSNPVGKHVCSKKHERFIFKEHRLQAQIWKEGTVMQVRLPNSNVNTASDLLCSSLNKRAKFLIIKKGLTDSNGCSKLCILFPKTIQGHKHQALIINRCSNWAKRIYKAFYLHVILIYV